MHKDFYNKQFNEKFIRERAQGPRKKSCPCNSLVQVVVVLQNPAVGQRRKKAESMEGLARERRQGRKARESCIIFFIILSICLHFFRCSVRQWLAPNSLKNKYNLSKLSEKALSPITLYPLVAWT